MSERAEWVQKPLSEVGELIRGRRFVKNDYVEAGLGCIHYAQIYTDFGPIARNPLTFLAEASRPRMRLAHSGDLIIAATSENVADVGKAVAWLGGDDVAVHDDCYIFRHCLDPVYVSYFFMSSLFHAQKIKYVSETKVVRISRADLNLIEIPIPPLRVQERIVEVIGAIDDQITALDGEAKAAETAAGAIAESMLANHAYVRIGNHLDRIEGGRSPQAIDKPPAEDEEGVLKASAVVAFQFIADESKTLAPGTEMPKSAEVQAGDVLVTRASGTIHRVGAVCRVPSDVRGGLYLSDKTLRMVPADGLDPDFLVIAMALSGVRRQITMAASGSASMKNISQSKIAGLQMPVPELTEQRKVASTVLSMRALGGTCRAEADRLRQVRAALLSGLLDRTIEIESAELEV